MFFLCTNFCFSQQTYNIETSSKGTMFISRYDEDTLVNVSNKYFIKDIVLQHIDSETVATSPFKDLIKGYLEKNKADSLDYFLLFNPTNDTFKYSNFGLPAFEFAFNQKGKTTLIDYFVQGKCGLGYSERVLCKNQLLIFKDLNNKFGKYKTQVKLNLSNKGSSIKSNTFTKYIDENIFYLTNKVYNKDFTGSDFYFFKSKLYIPVKNVKITIDGL